MSKKHNATTSTLPLLTNGYDQMKLIHPLWTWCSYHLYRRCEIAALIFPGSLGYSVDVSRVQKMCKKCVKNVQKIIKNEYKAWRMGQYNQNVIKHNKIQTNKQT